MKPNKCVGLRCRLTQPTRNGQGIVNMERTISFLGICVFISISYALSVNRQAVRWRTVAWGLGLEFILAIVILKTAWGLHLFKSLGNIVGKKTILNEFIAYLDLGEMIKKQEISQRSAIIATYALCNFANIGSIGITIGGMTGIAPNRQQDLARMGVRTMIGGLLAGFITAGIAGILI